MILQIEDLKFKLSTTEEQLENNHQLESELQLCKDHCIQLEQSRNNLTEQLEKARSDLIEVYTATVISQTIHLKKYAHKPVQK